MAGGGPIRSRAGNHSAGFNGMLALGMLPEPRDEVSLDSQNHGLRVGASPLCPFTSLIYKNYLPKKAVLGCECVAQASPFRLTTA